MVCFGQNQRFIYMAKNKFHFGAESIRCFKGIIWRYCSTFKIWNRFCRTIVKCFICHSLKFHWVSNIGFGKNCLCLLHVFAVTELESSNIWVWFEIETSTIHQQTNVRIRWVRARKIRNWKIFFYATLKKYILVNIIGFCTETRNLHEGVFLQFWQF